MRIRFPALLLFALLSLWLAISAALGAQLEMKQLTKDGKSDLPALGYVAQQTGKVAFRRKVTKDTCQLIVADANGQHEMTVDQVGWPANVFWSHDGKALVYTWEQGGTPDPERMVRVWRAGEGAPKTLYKGMRTSYWNFRWSPNSRFIVAVKTNLDKQSTDPGANVISIFNLASGREFEVNPTHSWSNTIDVCWSPDGRQFCFTAKENKDDKQGLFVCNIDGTHLQRLTPRDCHVSTANWLPGKNQIIMSVKYKRPAGDNFNDLWTIDADGKNMHAITSGGNTDPQHRYYYGLMRVTPDGRYTLGGYYFPDPKQKDNFAGGYAYFDNKTGEVIYAVGDDVNTNRRRGDIGLEMSPDGRRVLCLWQEWDITNQEATPWYVGEYFDLATRTRSELFRMPVKEGVKRTKIDCYPNFSPDGRRVYFTIQRAISETEEQWEADIYYFDLDQVASAPTTPTVNPTPVPTTPPPVVVTTPPALSTVPAQGGIILLPIQNIKAEDLIGTATQPGLLPSKYKDAIQLDKAQNALLFSGPPEMLAALQRDLQTIDIVPTQIAVDVLVMELSQSGARDLGLDSTYAKGRWAALLPIGNTSRIGPVDADGVPLLPANPESLGEIIYQGVGSLPKQFFVHLQALETSGDARIEASPRVVTTSGEPATIMVRQRVNFFYNIYYDGRATPTRGDISADINVKIIPILLGNGQVFLDVDALVGSFTFKGNSPLPDTTDRQVATRLTVPDGATFVLGGLKQNQRIVTNSKVPILGDLPLLGNLFRKTSRRNSESTLAIMITPRVLKPGASAPMAEMGK
jgi:Tol biopolymer transport system component